MVGVEEKEFSILVPKYDNSGRKIKSEIIEKFANKMSKRFGGVSIVPSVLGCWVNKDTGKLECEENIKMTSVRDLDNYKSEILKGEIIREDVKFIKSLSKEIGKELGQSEVLTIEDNVDASFIKGKRKKELEQEKLGVDWFEKLI